MQDAARAAEHTVSVQIEPSRLSVARPFGVGWDGTAAGAKGWLHREPGKALIASSVKCSTRQWGGVLLRLKAIVDAALRRQLLSAFRAATCGVWDLLPL